MLELGRSLIYLKELNFSDDAEFVFMFILSNTKPTHGF